MFETETQEEVDILYTKITFFLRLKTHSAYYTNWNPNIHLKTTH